MSRGERRKDKRAESPMQKQDVVVRASRLLVWDRRPRSCPCGTGALAGHSATFGPGRYPGPHLRNLRLGHNSPLQRQRRDTYQPLQRQRRDTYQPWLKAKETGPPKILTGLKARNITSRCRSIPNMFRAFSPLACFESHHLALQARLVCYAPSALRRTRAIRRWRSEGRLPLPIGRVIRPRQGHGAPGSAERQLGILLPSAPSALRRSQGGSWESRPGHRVAQTFR